MDSMDLYWRERANCKDEDVKYFTLGVKDDGVSTDWLKRTAEQFCIICPVRTECLDDATKEDLHHTLRGGVVPKRRPKILPEHFSSAQEDVDKFIARGKCARKLNPHTLTGPDDVVVHLDTYRKQGYRLRCYQCQEEGVIRYRRGNMKYDD